MDTDAILAVSLHDLQFEVRRSRKESEDLIRAETESTITALSRALRSARVVAAVARPPQIEMFTLGARSVATLPVDYLRDDGELVTRETANLRLVTSLDRVCREFQRRLGDPSPVLLGASPQAVTAAQLAAA